MFITPAAVSSRANAAWRELATVVWRCFTATLTAVACVFAEAF